MVLGRLFTDPSSGLAGVLGLAVVLLSLRVHVRHSFKPSSNLSFRVVAGDAGFAIDTVRNFGWRQAFSRLAQYSRDIVFKTWHGHSFPQVEVDYHPCGFQTAPIPDFG